jgi:hypothetical protein
MKKMKNRLMYVSVFIGLWLLSGCAEVIVGDKDWSFSQKQDFMDILDEDKYLSICDKQALYQEIKQTNSSKRMSEMLLAYIYNMENSCIDMGGFKTVQRQRKNNGIETSYTTYEKPINNGNIMLQLQAGVSIDEILAFYVPKNEQFSKLLNAYKVLSKLKTLEEPKLQKLRLNIERVKLMNNHLGEDYILVNIPEFMVRVKKAGETTLKFKIVVGKKHLQTPIFAEQLKYVTLNPQWSVPDSIARNEIIPALLKNSNYLKGHRMVVRKTYDLNSEKVSPSISDLKAYRGGKGHVPFKFIEVPSRSNALGRVKFIFPNAHSVYMHDTQMKKLFKHSVRSYSHGCVRLEKPNALLNYVTSHYTTKTLAEVDRWYKSMKTHYLKLSTKVMVHTVYMTAYIKSDGNLVMFDDIYSYDKYQKLNF